MKLSDSQATMLDKAADLGADGVLLWAHPALETAMSLACSGLGTIERDSGTPRFVINSRGRSEIEAHISEKQWAAYMATVAS